jgi:PqqD family protein of HPr-rel-A system
MALVAPPRRCDVLEHEADREGVLFDPRTGSTYYLNETAFAVWRQCDGRRSTRHIAEHQAELWDVDPGTALSDVEQVVAVLLERGLLEPGSDP